MNTRRVQVRAREFSLLGMIHGCRTRALSPNSNPNAGSGRRGPESEGCGSSIPLHDHLTTRPHGFFLIRAYEFSGYGTPHVRPAGRFSANEALPEGSCPNHRPLSALMTIDGYLDVLALDWWARTGRVDRGIAKMAATTDDWPGVGRASVKLRWPLRSADGVNLPLMHVILLSISSIASHSGGSLSTPQKEGGLFCV